MSYKDPRMARIESVAMEWLTRLNREDLTDKQQQEFFKWLEASPLHQAAYINAEDLWQRGVVLSKVNTTEANPWVDMRWGWAFAVTFLFVIGTWFLFPQQPNVQHYASIVGEQKEIALEDGSHLILNSDSSVSIQMDSSSRIAELQRGEIFFDVASDVERPFTVKTAQGQVRVVGTRFSVRQLAEDALVTVLEGKVALGEMASNKNFQAKQVLKANQRLSLQEAKAGHAPQEVEAQNLLAWRDRQLIFKGRPLADVVLELERYFAVKISFDDPELANREITAVLQLSDQKTTLDQLAMALGLSWIAGDQQGELRLTNSPN